MVVCVLEVCQIWIWLFRNVKGEGFEGSSVVRMARGKICFRLPFCRQEAVRARQKAVTANLNSRDLKGYGAVQCCDISYGLVRFVYER